METKILTLAAVALSLASCGGHGDSWTLKGNVKSGTETVLLEEPNLTGGWTVTDSVKPGGNGAFEFSRPRANGSIYRVVAGADTVYVPADSTEVIVLANDGGGYRLSGSENARLFNKVDSIVANVPGQLAVREALTTLDGNFASLAAYYATSRIDDWRLLRTVANRHVEELPTEPRTAVLRARFEQERERRGGKPQTREVVLEAPVTSYFDIELMDRNGKMQKLSSVVDNSPLAVLAFVDFSADSSPAVNLALGEANSAGAAIYEVGFAENQHLWALASESLPWTNVYQSESATRAHLQQYLVAQLPMFFVFRNGELTERVVDFAKLKNTL